MDHAHPFQYGSSASNGNNQQRPRRSRSFSTPITLSPLILPQQQDQPFALQNRRLQLRNVGFRGSLLSGRRINSQFTKWMSGSGEPEQDNDKENSPRSSQRRSLYGENLPPSPVNILQEISNSSTRKRSPRRSVATIFEDSPETQAPAYSPSTSWYLDASNQPSPAGPDSEGRDSIMKLRKVSVNGRSPPPPLSSPLAKQIRGRRKKALNLRSTSFEASKYIEHLESQLAASQTQVDSLTSPAITKPAMTKLKNLNAETRTLRQELKDWENKFEDRVKEEVAQRGDKISALERELELRDRKISELEWETERATQKLRGATALESTNRGLERRVDVLTELLAHSPIRTQHGIELAAPVRTAPRTTPRPKSMMPRIPSSPGGGVSLYRPLSMASPGSATVESHSSVASSPPTSNQSIDQQPDSPPNHGKKVSEDLASLDSGLGESCSMPSALASGSQRSSMISVSSATPSAWGLPLPMSPENKSKTPSRSRKMRRFPSGSCSLKPLILPTASAGMSIPASAPVYPSYSRPARDISGNSIDPTISFLSNPLFDTPTQPRRRSAAWAQEDTLKALEGDFDRCDSFEGALARHEAMISGTDPVPIPTEMMEPQFDGSFVTSPIQGIIFEEDVTAYLESQIPTETSMCTLAAQASITEEDIADAHQDDMISGLADMGQIPILEPIPIPVLEPVPILTSPTRLEEETCRRRRPPADKDSTPRPHKMKSFIDEVKSRPAPLTSIASTYAFGTISRYTSYFREIRRDPTALARRVIANAWHSNWKRLGSLSWWVLGLFLGPSGRDDKSDGSNEDDFDWHHYSAEASKVRRYASVDGPGPAIGPGEDLVPTATERTRPKSPKVTFEDTNLLASRKERPRCKDCVEPSSRFQSLRLWAKFSLALVLAVGVAVKDGPAAVLADCKSRNGNDKPISRAENQPRERSGTTPEHDQEHREDMDVQDPTEAGEATWGRKLNWVQNLSLKDFTQE